MRRGVRQGVGKPVEQQGRGESGATWCAVDIGAQDDRQQDI